MSSDPFFFPHACRRDHRAHTKRLLAGFLLVFIAALLLPSPTRAGDVEANVIDEAFTSWNETEGAGPDDLVDIFMDTASGSECEKFAGAAAYIAVVVSEYIERAPEPEAITEMDIINGTVTSLLYNDYVPLYNNCLNEE